jgi:hypothetical protein
MVLAGKHHIVQDCAFTVAKNPSAISLAHHCIQWRKEAVKCGSLDL